MSAQRLVTDRLDYQPGRILIQRTVREVHVAKGDADTAPVKPAAPTSLGLAATPRFTAYVTASKYYHHRPHYRTEDILLRRHGVRIPRHTLCHSDKVVADTLEPLYELIHQGLLQTGKLQADETPVRYLDPGKGKTSTGYFWVIHGPRCGIKPHGARQKELAVCLLRNHCQRTAIIYTMVECAKRHGHNPEAWLTEALERLPDMNNQDELSVLLPAKWQPAAAANKPLRETCPPEAKNFAESIHPCVCYLEPVPDLVSPCSTVR